MSKKSANINEFQDDLLDWGAQNPQSGVLEISGVKPTKKEVKLFDYQSETFEAFKVWWEGPQQEALIALTVGLGKTITACACVSHVLTQNKKVLWLTHREELLGQSKEELESLTGELCDIEKAERRAGYKAKIIVASVQSLKGKRLEKLASWFTPDIIVCDEAHHALAQTWMAVKTTFYTSKVLNLTATPYRSDISTRLNLGQVLIEKNTTDGIKMKRLVPPKPVGKLELNLGKVKKTLGDYEVGSLSKFLTQDKVINGCVELIQRHYLNRKGIIFAASVEHGRLIAAKLEKEGIKVGQIYGVTPTNARQALYEDILAGRIDMLINNLCLCEGFNMPELDFVVILRPTKNAALYLQMLGRGLRALEGKTECLLIDIIDTAKRKTAEDSYILPSEEDCKKLATMTGRPESFGSTFLSWFFNREEVLKVVRKELQHGDCAPLNSGAQIYSLFFNKPKEGWREYQKRVITVLDEVLNTPGSNAKDPSDYGKIFEAIRCGNTEAFIRLMAKGGWSYFPHGQIPNTLAEAEEHEAIIAEMFDKDETESYNIETLISADADLRNFIMDIFGDEKDLSEQAKKYYEIHRIDGNPVVWYIPSNVKGGNFCFIKVDNAFWIKTKDDTNYVFSTGHGFVTQMPAAKITLRMVPPYNLSTQWAKETITSKQAIQVAKILKISEQDLSEAHISRLSASALMTAAWSKKYLVKIAGWLARNHTPRAVTTQDLGKALEIETQSDHNHDKVAQEPQEPQEPQKEKTPQNSEVVPLYQRFKKTKA